MAINPEAARYQLAVIANGKDRDNSSYEWMSRFIDEVEEHLKKTVRTQIPKLFLVKDHGNQED